MRLFTLGILSLAMLCNGIKSAAAFDEIPTCHIPTGVQATDKQDGTPSALRAALKQKLGDMVPPKAPFDATDVVWTGHNRRLIFIWNLADRWIIATEHGGRGYNDPIFVYTVSPDGQKATLLAERIAFPNSVCSVAEELLSFKSGTTTPRK
jgi:hypothetical protein